MIEWDILRYIKSRKKTVIINKDFKITHEELQNVMTEGNKIIFTYWVGQDLEKVEIDEEELLIM